MNMDYVLMGRKIWLERKKQGLTQKELAALLNISFSFYGHIERGTRKMSLQTFANICEILDVNANDLLSVGNESTLTPSPSGFAQPDQHIEKVYIYIADLRK